MYMGSKSAMRLSDTGGTEMSHSSQASFENANAGSFAKALNGRHLDEVYVETNSEPHCLTTP